VLAAFENELRAEVVLRETGWDDGILALELEARLVGATEQLVFRQGRDTIRWEPPAPLRAELPEDTLDVTEELERSQVQVLLRSKRTRAEFSVQARLEVVPVSAGEDRDVKSPVLVAVAEIDPRSAAAGSPLAPGDWEVHVLVDVADFTAVTESLRPKAEARLRRPAPKTLTLTVTTDGRLMQRTPLKRELSRRLPGLVQRFRRFRRRGRAAIARARRRPAT